MKNVFLWGLDNKILRNSLLFLEREKSCSIKVWFGKKTINVVTHNWIDMVNNGLKEAEFIQCDKIIHQQMYQYLYPFMDMLSHKLDFQNKAVHEYLNIFNILLHCFYRLLKIHKIDIIIFENIPHDAPNYMLYNLAKLMKIQTLIISHSMFPNRFFYTEDVEDFGLFQKKYEYKLDTKKTQFLKMYGETEINRKKSINKIYEKVATKLISKWKQKRIINKQRLFQKNIGIMDYVEKYLCKELLNYQLANTYRRNMKENFKAEVDLTAKFIYFPLQGQEEIQTSVLSDMYRDQLLAIERLVLWIPKDWYVYVEENVAETKNMRGKIFFERLKAIPKVKTIKGNHSITDLIMHSQFVSTITGEVGWEAIHCGKNVVVFGKVWYLKFPGVFQYDADLSLQDVQIYKINQRDLEKKLTLLFNKMGDGIINPDFSSTIPDFNEQENNQKLVDFFRQVLLVHL